MKHDAHFMLEPLIFQIYLHQNKLYFGLYHQCLDENTLLHHTSRSMGWSGLIVSVFVKRSNAQFILISAI
jgi:hypothetical protein